MVRLKFPIVLCSAALAHIFQFHYGSIKIITDRSAKIGKLNFNSTMVRLKSNVKIANVLSVTIFQFHYGSIKILR